jgi:putative Mg2+ transporter-C (MgtC) family protein
MFPLYASDRISWLMLLEFALRIILAMCSGAVIGYERSRRFKGAGLRTHVIVCAASALIMVISKYGFTDMATSTGLFFEGVRGTDPARLAAQVISGISFLGAGVIFKNKGAVSGLTTAAGLWCTAGIGLAIGGGMYVLGIFTTAMIALFQYLLHKFKVGSESMPLYQISFTVLQSQDFQNALDEQLKEWAIHLVDMRMSKKDNGKVAYDLSLRASYKLDTEEILSFFNKRDDVVTVSVIMP